ncbi:MAG: hypothetical protein K0R55_3353 [Sporomusa sp.]|jgi:hypothetical protein|nr:hypothetical protein [Sporomusa sp.]
MRRKYVEKSELHISQSGEQETLAALTKLVAAAKPTNKKQGWGRNKITGQTEKTEQGIAKYL